MENFKINISGSGRAYSNPEDYASTRKVQNVISLLRNSDLVEDIEARNKNSDSKILFSTIARSKDEKVVFLSPTDRVAFDPERIALRATKMAIMDTVRFVFNKLEDKVDKRDIPKAFKSLMNEKRISQITKVVLDSALIFAGKKIEVRQSMLKTDSLTSEYDIIQEAVFNYAKEAANKFKSIIYLSAKSALEFEESESKPKIGEFQ